MKKATKTMKLKVSPSITWEIKSLGEITSARKNRDSIAAAAYEKELATKREQVLEMDAFIREVLNRADIKTTPKPGAAVVRVLMTERGMTTFTANRHWNEFRLVGFDRNVS